MKWRYDKRHIPLLLNSGDFVSLKLYHGYRVPGVKNKKLGLQRVGRFKVKRRISSLTYELKLLSYMKIYFVISITNLESFFLSEDLYRRSYDDYPPTMEEENRSEE